MPFLMWQCTDVKDWHDATDNVAPGVLSNVTVKNINGGAWIYYTQPGDNDLLGVKAVYSFAEGKEMEAFASAFNDSILIEGAPDTQARIVKLYVIDKSQNESAFVEQVINPLTPPVELIRQSMKVNSTFGGLNVDWENPFGDDIAVLLYVRDSIGDFIQSNAAYSKTTIGNVVFNGYKNEEQVFRLDIRDKWRHYSLPLDTVLTPMLEEQIYGRDQLTGAFIWTWWGWPDDCVYRGDAVYCDLAANRSFNTIHDGVAFNDNAGFWIVNWDHFSTYIDWPNNSDMPNPVYITIDMGRKANYSRLKYWMRPRNPWFSGGIMTSFEVWGTNDPKPLNAIGDGSKADNLKYWTQWPEVSGTDEWKNDWIKLVDYKMVFPSGLAPISASAPNLTADDREFVSSGFQVTMDPANTDKACRYVRFVIRDFNDGKFGTNQITELQFFGSYAD
jgi:hypothetical protein